MGCCSIEVNFETARPGRPFFGSPKSTLSSEVCLCNRPDKMGSVVANNTRIRAFGISPVHVIFVGTHIRGGSSRFCLIRRCDFYMFRAFLKREAAHKHCSHSRHLQGSSKELPPRAGENVCIWVGLSTKRNSLCEADGESAAAVQDPSFVAISLALHTRPTVLGAFNSRRTSQLLCADTPQQGHRRR